MTGRPRARWSAVAATSFQRDFWFLDRAGHGSGTYNVAATMPWPAPPDIEVVTGLATEIAARQPALRTRLEVADDVLYAMVSDRAGAQLDVSAVRAPPSGWDAIVADLAREPVDPGAAGTVRLRLLSAPPGTESPSTPWLCAVSHHALIDGRSLVAFLSEVCARAAGQHHAEPSHHRPGVSAAAQLTDFRRHHDDDVAYWTRRLRPATRPREPQPMMRRRKPRPAEVESVGLRLGPAHRQAVAGFAAGERSSAFLVLVAGFLLALREDGHGEDLVVGVAVDGRPATVDRGEYGCFTTVLPLRVDTTGTPRAGGVAAMHACLREVFLDGLDRTTITVRDLQLIAGRAGLSAPYRYMATMLAPAEDVRPISAGTKADLALTMIDRDGDVDCLFVYRPDAFTRAEVTDLAATFVRVLAGL